MTPIEADFNPVNHEHFKAVNHEHRGVRYLKHSAKINNGSNRFISDTGCPQCGSYVRRWMPKTDKSRCVTCMQGHSRKGAQKKEAKAGYVALDIEKRRAIEAHQERSNEHYNNL